jgi:hypothetical protein
LHITLIKLTYFIVIRLDEKDAALLGKAMQYSQAAFEIALKAKEAAIESKEAALEAKEAALRIEATINEYLEEKASQDKCSDADKPTSNNKQKKTIYWYTESIIYYISF